MNDFSDLPLFYAKVDPVELAADVVEPEVQADIQPVKEPEVEPKQEVDLTPVEIVSVTQRDLQEQADISSATLADPDFVAPNAKTYVVDGQLILSPAQFETYSLVKRGTRTVTESRIYFHKDKDADQRLQRLTAACSLFADPVLHAHPDTLKTIKQGYLGKDVKTSCLGKVFQPDKNVPVNCILIEETKSVEVAV